MSASDAPPRAPIAELRDIGKTYGTAQNPLPVLTGVGIWIVGVGAMSLAGKNTRPDKTKPPMTITIKPIA